MNPIKKISLSKFSIEGFWAIPTSGYGNVCDEQPLPYLRNKYGDLTPRLGGEINENNYSPEIVPLPHGKLTKKWPISQRFFNLNRRKINLYWKNIFKSKCNRKKIFLFFEQLNFRYVKNGFQGDCPLLIMKRFFNISNCNIIVEDEINFKEKIEFDYFHINPFIEIEKNNLLIETSYKCNFKKNFKSSTGVGTFRSYLIKNCIFKKNESIKYNYKYNII